MENGTTSKKYARPMSKVEERKTSKLYYSIHRDILHYAKMRKTARYKLERKISEPLKKIAQLTTASVDIASILKETVDCLADHLKCLGTLMP